MKITKLETRYIKRRKMSFDLISISFNNMIYFTSSIFCDLQAECKIV